MTLNLRSFLCVFLLFGATTPLAHAGQGKLLYSFKNGFELRFNESSPELTHSFGRPGDPWHRSETIPVPEGYELKQVLAGMTNNLSEDLPDSAQLILDPLKGGGSVAFFFVSLKKRPYQQSATKWLLVADSSGSWNWMMLEHRQNPKDQQQESLSQQFFKIGTSMIQGEWDPKLSSNEFTYHGSGLRAFEANEKLFIISAFGIYSLGDDIKKKSWYHFGNFSFQDMTDSETFALKRNGQKIEINARNLIFKSSQNMLHTGKLIQNLNPSELLSDKKTRSLLLRELDYFPFLEFTDLDLVVDFIEARWSHVSDQDEASRMKAALIRAIGRNVQLSLSNLSNSPKGSDGRIQFPIIENQLCDILAANHTRYLHSSHRFGTR